MGSPLLIGLTGKAGSGKDTFYQYAKEVFPEKKIQRLAFADLVREMAEEYFGWDPDGDKEEQRHILQGVGMMVREEFDEDYWLDYAIQQIDWDADIVIFTDCRFPNELAAIEAAGGRSVRVESHVDNNLQVTDHESEYALDNWEVDDTVYNVGNNSFKSEVEDSISYYLVQKELEGEIGRLSHLVSDWAHDRNLIAGSTPRDQFLKLMEEFAEYEDATSMDIFSDARDALGDMLVVVIIMASMYTPSISYRRDNFPWVMKRIRKQSHQKDKFRSHHGLPHLLGLLGGSIARHNKEGARQALANIYFELDRLSAFAGADIGKCLAQAWEEIKDRKGQMVDGVFVKEEDL